MGAQEKEETLLDHKQYLWIEGQSFVCTFAPPPPHKPEQSAQPGSPLAAVLQCLLCSTEKMWNCTNSVLLSSFYPTGQKNVFCLLEEKAEQKAPFHECQLETAPQEKINEKSLSLKKLFKVKSIFHLWGFGVLLPPFFCFPSLCPAAYTDFLSHNKMKFININSEWHCFV